MGHCFVLLSKFDHNYLLLLDKSKQPVRYPDGQTLGTIWILDNQRNEFEDK